VRECISGETVLFWVGESVGGGVKTPVSHCKWTPWAVA